MKLTCKEVKLALNFEYSTPRNNLLITPIFITEKFTGLNQTTLLSRRQKAKDKR